MRGAFLLSAIALGASGCVVGTLDLDGGFACDTGSHPCVTGYRCAFSDLDVVGVCVPSGPGGSAGSSSGGGSGSGGTTGGSSSGGTTGSAACTAAPTCADGGALRLCDGGLQACGTGLICDWGECLTKCSAGGVCSPGVCDTSVGACVSTNSCATDGGSCSVGAVSGLCLAGVCTPVPPSGSAVGACTSPGDAGMVLVEGPVAIFPNANAPASLEDGGTVTFFNASQTLPAVPILPSTGTPFPSYSIAVPVGTWTAIVQQPGVLVPTYFPGLEVRAPQFGSTVTLSFPLDAAVALDALPATTGAGPQPGHIFWVGRATSCDETSYLGDYTVGLSPAPPVLDYLDKVGGQVQVVPGLTASSSLIGEFLVEDAAYATTQYVLAANGGSGTTLLASGTFTPQPFVAGQDIAVALVYPNFTQ